MKIAIVRLSSLGDIIFCMAALQVIRHHRPDSEITWFADAKFADILDHNPDLKHVIKIDLKRLKKDFSFSGLKREYGRLLEWGKFDVAIDLHGMIKSAVISRITAGKATCGFHPRTAKEPLTNLLYGTTFDIPLDMNTVYRYASLAARSLDIPLSEEELIHKRPFLFYGEDDAAFTREYFCKDRKNIVLVVGSTWESRNYPKEKFVTIANALQGNTLICYGNEAELQTARYIQERSPHVRILPRMNLNQLKAAISRADLVIGGDTGPTHIAWANNIPCIVIFGPTPAHRIYAGATCRIIKSSSPVDDRKLDQNDFSIREIPEAQVIDLARELLADVTTPSLGGSSNVP
ncbi:MAG TPA: lipopolysaccharide heptosyltransferase I [Desulfuromonadaceae bacterium]